MAARLRAEAASLEAQKAQDTANATQRANAKFDTNSDGQVTLDELKAGLEKAWKAELPDTRVKQLMDVFDVSGDGVLQVDEFVSIDQFRTRMESMIRDEQVAAKDLQRQARWRKRRPNWPKLDRVSSMILHLPIQTRSYPLYHTCCRYWTDWHLDDTSLRDTKAILPLWRWQLF